jgi:hypothetical protein
VENVPGHRDHHSGGAQSTDHDQPGLGDHDRPESLIIIVRNPHIRQSIKILADLYGLILVRYVPILGLIAEEDPGFGNPVFDLL